MAERALILGGDRSASSLLKPSAPPVFHKNRGVSDRREAVQTFFLDSLEKRGITPDISPVLRLAAAYNRQA